jgi:hypothetical protein
MLTKKRRNDFSPTQSARSMRGYKSRFEPSPLLDIPAMLLEVLET